jgi:hypothetical protein
LRRAMPNFARLVLDPGRGGRRRLSRHRRRSESFAYILRGVTRRSLGALAVAIALAGCGGGDQSGQDEGSSAANAKLLRVSRLHGTVVRMGTLHGEPLYGVRLIAFVCSRSAALADRTYPTSFRIGHYVAAGRATTHWPKAFRVMSNELHWLVPLGETTRGACRRAVEFEDFIPPANYGGLESPLGLMGYSRTHRCYGIELTLRAVLANRRRTTMSASRRAIIQCGRFRPS